MSVKELRLVNEDIVMTIRRTGTKEEMWSVTMHEPACWVDMILDRNSAHLLYLYLQQHLGFNEPLKMPDRWLCKCGKYHTKDYICTMLK